MSVSSFGPVAQRLEQGTHNPLVVGSNPTGPTTLTSLSTIGKVFIVLGKGYCEGLSSHLFRKATSRQSDPIAFEIEMAKRKQYRKFPVS